MADPSPPKGKVVKRYSNLLTLSDAPRRSRVDIDREENIETASGKSGSAILGHTVSAPIAKRIQNLYHHKPVGAASSGAANAQNSHYYARKTSLDEKHPMALQESDSTAPGKRRSGLNVPPVIATDSQEGQVYIRLGGGQELVFNDNLGAMELSPTAGKPSVQLPADSKSGSLQRSRHSGDKSRSSGCSSSVPRNLHSNALQVKYTTKPIGAYDDIETCDINSDSDSEVEESDTVVLILDTAEPGESTTDEQCGDIQQQTDDSNDSKVSTNVATPVSGEGSVVKKRQSIYTSVNRRVSAAPSLKKIDRYRASLRRRKVEQRSRSEPRFGESRNGEAEHLDTDTNASEDNKENQLPASDRCSRYAESNSSSWITRSCSLSSLHRINSLDDIPKGIARSKIEEIQRRMDEHERVSSEIVRTLKNSATGASNRDSVHSPSRRTVISPGGRVTSPESVTSPRNIVTQFISSSSQYCSSTPLFIGGVAVTENTSCGVIAPPPRRSRNRNSQQTANSITNVLAKFGVQVLPTQSSKAESISAEPSLSALKRKASDNAAVQGTNTGAISITESTPKWLLEKAPDPPFQIASERSAFSSFKPASDMPRRSSSVPPSVILDQSQKEDTNPAPVPPPRKKTAAPPVPVSTGSEDKPAKTGFKSRRKGPAPLPPGAAQTSPASTRSSKEGSDTQVSLSTDDTSSSGDAMSVQSTEGVIAMDTSDSGSSSEHARYENQPYDIDQSNHEKTIEDNQTVPHIVCDPPEEFKDNTLQEKNNATTDDDDFLDGDQPFTFTGLDLHDLNQIPVLMLEGVTNTSSCDYDEENDNESSDTYDFKVNNTESSDVLNISSNSEADSVVTVVEKEHIYFDMSRSNSIVPSEPEAEYMTMHSDGTLVRIKEDEMNDNYMGKTPDVDKSGSSTTERDYLSLVSSTYDYRENNEIIYSTIVRGETLPRTCSVDENANDNVPQQQQQNSTIPNALSKSDSAATVESVGESSGTGSLAGDEDTDDTIVGKHKRTAYYSSSEDTLEDLDTCEDNLYETIGNIERVQRAMASRPRELDLLVKQQGNREGIPRDPFADLLGSRRMSEQPIRPIAPPTPRRMSEQVEKASPLGSSAAELGNKSKSKSKAKKKNKKSSKKDKSPSPTGSAKREVKTPITDRVSSDDDLLSEKRRRAMSPGAVARGFVSKVLKVRPSSPKDRSEKILSPLDTSGRKSPFNFRKNMSSPVVTKKVTLLSSDWSGPVKEFHRSESNSTWYSCESETSPLTPGSDPKQSAFNVNRYAGNSPDIGGNSSRQTDLAFRASKSMGDIHEAMHEASNSGQTGDTSSTSSAQIDQSADQDTVTITVAGKKSVAFEEPVATVGRRPSRPPSAGSNQPRRTLPVIPMKRGMPVLVKVVGQSEDMECQHVDCCSRDNTAVKVCHHSECTSNKGQQALMLCAECDRLVHSPGDSSSKQADDVTHNTGSASTHVRFDVFRKGGINRNSSVRSLPDQSQSEEERDGQDDSGEGSPTGTLKRRRGFTKKRHNTVDVAKRQVVPLEQRSQSAQILRPLVAHSEDECASDDESYSSQLNVNLKKGRKRNESEPMCHSGDVTSPSNQTADSVSDNRNNTGPLSSANSAERLEQSIEGSIQQFKSSTSWYTSLEEAEEPVQLETSLVEGRDSEPYTNIDQSKHSRNEDRAPSADTLQTQKSFEESQENKNHRNLKSPDAVNCDTCLREQYPLTPEGSSGVEVKATSKTTAPTTPKTPPHLPDVIKKYSNTSEYFTLELDVLQEPAVFEIVSAQKGVNLRDAVRPCLERRGINVNNVSIYLASSNTPLPLLADCFVLGGSHLHVKAKEPESSLARAQRTASSSSLNSAASSSSGAPSGGKQSRAPPAPSAATVVAVKSAPPTSQRGRKCAEDSGVGSDVSPGGTFTSGDTARYRDLKQSNKLRFFSGFGKGQQEKQELLLAQLDSYSTSGLPPMPALLDLGGTQARYDPAMFALEQHWSALTGVKPAQLSKKQKDQQEAIWELVHTESQYIRKLQVVVDLFYCCLLDLQNEGLLCEIRTEELFSNVLELANVSRAFWIVHIRPLLEHSRTTRQLLDPTFLFDGFMQFDSLFQPYAKYCLEQKACLEYIKSNERDNELFRMFIQWAEAQKQCSRLKLQDLVISPMQRLTKYKLLLIAILKKTENEAHRKQLKAMIEKVERFVLQVNTVMHQRDEHERLSMIIDRIESYDVVDTANDELQKLMSEFCKLDLTCPVPGCGPQQRRHLLLEGGLKFRDTPSASKTDVYCFLFTDMLLITKPNRRGDKVKVTRPPMRLDKCVVHMLRDHVSFALLYLNEYHMATAVHTFQGEASKVWVDHVRKAQESYKALRKSVLEQNEHRMYWEMFYEENYEDEVAVINASGRPGHQHNGAMSHSERQDSSASLDSYSSSSTGLPSSGTGSYADLMHRSISQGALRYNSAPQYDAERSKSLRNSASLDETSMLQTEALAAKDDVQRSDSEPVRPNNFSLPRPRHNEQHHQYSDSSPNDSPSVSRSSNTERYMSKKLRNRHEARRTDSQSSEEGCGPVSSHEHVSRHHPSSGSRFKTLPHDTTGAVEDQNARNGRLNQRRISRGDKRYYTADAIEDIREKDAPRPDASIQKRRSWNFGTVDISIGDEGRHQYLKSKTISSDSLRSMPSSSGVSSTGSLHLSPESEICEEECEDDDDDDEPQMALLNAAPIGASPGTARVPASHQSHLHFDSQHSDGSSTNESCNTLTEHLDQSEECLDSDSSDSNSQTPTSRLSSSSPHSTAQRHDITHGNLPRDGNGPVGESRTSNNNGGNSSGSENSAKKKMGHGEYLRIKNQLLLNSTLEASEV